MTDPAILDGFLDRHTTVTLATVGADNIPAAAAVFYATEPGGRLLFLTATETRHGQNMRDRPEVAVTVQADGQTWRDIEGVQMTGIAERLTGEAAYLARENYLVRFTDLKDLSERIAATPIWRFTPLWARLIDNTQGFGHKDEWDFS